MPPAPPASVAFAHPLVAKSLGLSFSSYLLGQVSVAVLRAPLRDEKMVKFVGMFNQAPQKHRLMSARVEKRSGLVQLLYKVQHDED